MAYWMGGIAAQYTKFEKVEIQSAVCKWDAANTQWSITMKLKNSGTATATLIGVYINEVEVDSYTLAIAPAAQATTDMGVTRTILSGETVTIGVYIDSAWGAPVTSGTTVNIRMHSAGGMDYIKLVELV